MIKIEEKITLTKEELTFLIQYAEDMAWYAASSMIRNEEAEKRLQQIKNKYKIKTDLHLKY